MRPVEGSDAGDSWLTMWYCEVSVKREIQKKKMVKESADASAYKEYLAGLTAGLATVIIGHPFDTVKVSPLSSFFAYAIITFWIG